MTARLLQWVVHAAWPALRTAVLGPAWVMTLAMPLAMSLVACGGGGSDAPPNALPTARAGADQTVLAGTLVRLDGSASTDPEGAALGFAWSIVSAPAGSRVTSAALTGPASAQPSFVPDLPGVYQASLVVGDGAGTSAAATVTVTALSTAGLSITVDQTDPVSGTVQLGLSGPTAGAAVTWYVDLNQIGTGPAAAWNTTAASPGAHQVLARIALAGSDRLDITRTVAVANTAITLSAAVAGMTGTVRVDVRAGSPTGIGAVSATFDGTPLATLAAPNACSSGCSGPNDVYRFTIDATRAGSGNHSLVVTAVDGAGGSRQITVAVPISNAPVIALASPVDGALVTGRLQLSGSATTDKTGGVTVVASLGDLPILTASGPAFSGSHDLTGLVPGAYTLTVQATDATGGVTRLQRTVIVSTDSSLTYPPLMSLGATGALLAAEGDRILYAAEDQSVRLRDTTTGTEVTLQGGPVAYARDWQLSGGRAYTFGQGNDCGANFVCVYQWAADGTRRNLSAGNPWAGSSYQQHPVAKAGQVLWCNDGGGRGGSYTLYDVAAGTYRQILPPPGMAYVGNWNFDLAVVGGVPTVVYWGQTGGSGTASAYEVYRWSADTGVSSRLSPTGLRSVYVATDGQRAAWSQSVVGNTADPTTLVAAPLSGGTPTALSSTMSQFLLRDGVLAWSETNPGSRAVRASTGGTTKTLSILNTAALYATSAGTVVYSEAGRLYSWDAASDRIRLRLDALPEQVLVSGQTMYLVVGQSQTLYKVPLSP